MTPSLVVTAQDYVRAAADILRPSRDSFVLRVPPAGGDAASKGSSPADPDAARSTVASDLNAMVAAGPAELLAALQRRAAELTGAGEKAQKSTANPKEGVSDPEACALGALPPPSGGTEGADSAEGEQGDAGKDSGGAGGGQARQERMGQGGRRGAP